MVFGSDSGSSNDHNAPGQSDAGHYPSASRRGFGFLTEISGDQNPKISFGVKAGLGSLFYYL